MPKIEEMYAYISSDKDTDDEGIVGFQSPRGHGWTPCVGADMDRMESLRPMVELIAIRTGKTITLTKFSTKTVLEVIEPEGIKEYLAHEERARLIKALDHAEEINGFLEAGYIKEDKTPKEDQIDE